MSRNPTNNPEPPGSDPAEHDHATDLQIQVPHPQSSVTGTATRQQTSSVSESLQTQLMNTSADVLLKPLSLLADGMRRQLAQSGVSKAELTVALDLTAEGNVYVASLSGKSSLTVKLTWERK